MLCPATPNPPTYAPRTEPEPSQISNLKSVTPRRLTRMLCAATPKPHTYAPRTEPEPSQISNLKSQISNPSPPPADDRTPANIPLK